LASNPGGPGHDWIKARYIEPHTVKDRITIRARLEDNPHVDREAYLRSLDELDPITRRQLLDGDWSAKHGGSLFKREWFATKIIREAPTDLSRVVRYWDLAATEAKAGRDPDWTAGALMGLWPGKGVILLDVVRRRESPRGVRSLIRSTAEADAARWGSKLHIAWEEEGGSGGKFASEELARDLAGFSFGPDRKHGGDSKMALAGPVSSQAEAGNIWILAGDWIGDTIDELEAFPQGSHDDRVDSISGAYRKLVAAKTPRLTFIGA
jgi:predicted phage terminase large subunit-like protein